MVTQKDMQDYGFKSTSIIEYFEYILQTQDGKTDFKELYAELSKDQKALFMTWLLAMMAKDNPGLSGRDDYRLLIRCIQNKQ